MEFNLLASLIAGFLATVIMTLATELAALQGATSMPSMPLLLGAFVSGDHDLAMAVGSAVHYVVIGTLVNGAIYGLVVSFTGAGMVLAAILGMAHGVLIGVGLGRLKEFHPRVEDRPAGKSGAAGPAQVGEVTFNDPEMFGVGWGDLTPAVLVGAYVIYGLVFAFVYSLIV